MKRYSVLFTDEADRNRLEIALYYDIEAGTDRADRFLDAVENTALLLQENPYLGRVYEENGVVYDGEHVRRIALNPDDKGSRYPYYFIYRIQEQRVLVLRIHGDRQDEPALIRG